MKDKKVKPNGKKQVIEDYCGIKVYRLPIMVRISNTPINPLWYLALKSIIRAEKPDIINSHQPVPFIGDLTAFLAGNIPFVLTYHSGTMQKNKFLLDIIIFLYEMLILPHTARKATRIICASNFVRNTILKRYAFKSTIIHPGVDISLFKPNPVITKDQNLTLFICHYKSMHRIKGLYYLLEAIKELPEIKLCVVGEKGDFVDKRIISVGLKRGKDLVIPEVIEDGIDGFIVSAKDSNALAMAISKIVADKELATRMGHFGEAKVREKLTWDSRVALTKEVFASCLK